MSYFSLLYDYFLFLLLSYFLPSTLSPISIAICLVTLSFISVHSHTTNINVSFFPLLFLCFAFFFFQDPSPSVPDTHRSPLPFSPTFIDAVITHVQVLLLKWPEPMNMNSVSLYTHRRVHGGLVGRRRGINNQSRQWRSVISPAFRCFRTTARECHIQSGCGCSIYFPTGSEVDFIDLK